MPINIRASVCAVKYTSPAAPGPTLVKAATAEPGIAASSIGRFVGKHLPRSERAESTTWTRFPRPWRVDGFMITDKHGKEVLLTTLANIEPRPEETKQLLRDVVAKVNGAIVDDDEVF